MVPTYLWKVFGITPRELPTNSPSLIMETNLENLITITPTPSVRKWILIRMDRNYKGIDENCREIDLIRSSHPP